MLAKDDLHARHLVAMPSEREALIKAIGILERELRAVGARETVVLAAVLQRSADEFHRDWLRASDAV